MLLSNQKKDIIQLLEIYCNLEFSQFISKLKLKFGNFNFNLKIKCVEEEMENMDYWFFGSEYFVRQEGRDKSEDMDEVCFNPKYKKMVKFTSAYEDGKSHGEIGRGNITPERSIEFTVP